MKKIFVIGVIFLFIGIAVAPSINSTIAKNTNTNRTKKNNITLQSENILIKKVIDIIKKGGSFKHPLLLVFVLLIGASFATRSLFLFVISTRPNPGHQIGWHIVNPLLFERSEWLMVKLEQWDAFWNNVSTSLGWNWPWGY